VKEMALTAAIRRPESGDGPAKRGSDFPGRTSLAPAQAGHQDCPQHSGLRGEKVGCATAGPCPFIRGVLSCMQDFVAPCRFGGARRAGIGICPGR